MEPVPRPLATVGEDDGGRDQNQSRRCLGMRRLQRNDKLDGGIDLPPRKEVIVGTLSHKPGSAGFLSWVLFNEGTEQPVEVMEVKAGIT